MPQGSHDRRAVSAAPRTEVAIFAVAGTDKIALAELATNSGNVHSASLAALVGRLRLSVLAALVGWRAPVLFLALLDGTALSS
eukprot:764533-Pyramimonas_sp.AAC.1